MYESADFGVETKDDHSPLTAADRAAHVLIVRELQALTPDIPVMSEESATIPFEERAGWAQFWLVDPLDGTKEFIKRNGEFTVNIALIRGHEPVLGVVHVPARDEDYLRLSRPRAFLRCAGGRRRGHRRTARPRTRSGSWAAAPTAVLAGGFPRPPGDPRNGAHGQSSLKLCLVASGAADVYPRLGPTSEWDTAAAQAVVECAGGRVVDLEGQPIRYNTGPDILNPYFLVYADTATRLAELRGRSLIPNAC